LIILFILVWGLFAGWLANLLLGGASRPAEWGPLLIAGLLGSFVGGLLINLISGDGLDVAPSGLIGSVVGAIIVLAIMRAARSRA
jgi:uncharacterized membrane protein YeaQ/YmgE (transglycosylase-associated protein family)